jgi:hypothetical protein
MRIRNLPTNNTNVPARGCNSRGCRTYLQGFGLNAVMSKLLSGPGMNREKEAGKKEVEVSIYDL